MGVIASTLGFIQTFWKAITVLLLLVITLLSLYPLPALPEVPGADKTHHLIAYGFLAFPAALKGPNKLTILLLCFVAFGGLIELIQPYVNRYGEWLDFVANTAGVALGTAIGTYWKHKLTAIA